MWCGGGKRCRTGKIVVPPRDDPADNLFVSFSIGFSALVEINALAHREKKKKKKRPK